MKISVSRPVLIAITVGVVISGCSAPQEEPWAEYVAPWGQEVEEAIEEAVAAGASQSQLDILRGSTAETGVSFEDAKSSILRAVECMEEVGISATYEERWDPRGYYVPGYTAVVTDNSSFEERLMSCDERESFWVNKLYQSQPSALEATTAKYAPLVPTIKACLEREGADFDHDTDNFWDLVEPAHETYLQSGRQVDCMAEAGVGNY